MRSMAKYLRPADISAQMRMERQRHKGAFILLEGADDIKRFRKFFIEADSSIVNCYGKANVVGAVEIEQNSGRSDVIGFVDVDFDKILNLHQENDDLIFSNCHDFDLDVCLSDAICRYLEETGDESKINALGGPKSCVEVILIALRPLSALRFANIRHNLRYSLGSLNHEEFFDGVDVDLEALISHVSLGKFNSEANKAVLRQHIARYCQADFDLWQFTNGHDFFAALGIALRSRIGNRKNPQTWRSEVEKHLRLTFDINDLDGIGCLPKVLEWQGRTGFRIIRNS